MSEREERMRELLRAAYAAPAPSEALKERVAAAARHVAARPDSVRQRRPWRLGFALVGIGSVTLLLGALAPSWMTARLLMRADAAASRVKSLHSIGWKVKPDGSREKDGEQWYQDGRWRLESTSRERLTIYTNGKLWIHDAAENRVIAMKKPEGPFGYNQSGFSLAAMTRDYARWGWRQRFRPHGETTVNGRKAHVVALEEPGARERTLLVVDAATDLLVRFEMQQEEKGRFVTRRISATRYDVPLAASLFVPKFPKGVPVFDMDMERKRWEQRLTKGIARKRAGDRVIVIRDLQVNAEGDVFLLYTAGQLPTDSGAHAWEAELIDDRGTRYRRGSHWQPYMRGFRGLSGDGFVLEGHKLEADWWVPVESQEPWQPRTFTVTFRVPPVTHHGPEPGPDQPRSASAVFRHRVERPETPRVPAYMPFMADQLDSETLGRGKLQARASYYRWQKRDFARALALHRQILRERDERARALGEPIRDPSTWLEIARLLRILGQREQALLAAEQGLSEAGYPDSVRDDAEKLVARLKSEIERGDVTPADGR